MLNRYSKLGSLFVLVASLICGALYPAASDEQAIVTSPAPAASAVVSMDGPGGRVSLGDTLAQAKKAFPQPEGAEVDRMGMMQYPMFMREGWGWGKAEELFGVRLLKGRVDSMYRCVFPPSDESLDNLIERTIEKLGTPTAQAFGVTNAIYAWEAKPYIRFLTTYREKYTRGKPMAVCTVGNLEELKMMGRSSDSIKQLVERLDRDVVERSSTRMAPAILSLLGPGGKVIIGDTLEQAQKSFPPREGAKIGGAFPYAVPLPQVSGSSRRDDWSWSSQKPKEGFEVHLVQGKVVGMIRSVGVPGGKASRDLMEKALQEFDPPTYKMSGKTVTLFYWLMYPNSRVLIQRPSAEKGGDSWFTTIIGDEVELRNFGIRADELRTSVDMMDSRVEAARKAEKVQDASKKRRVGKR